MNKSKRGSEEEQRRGIGLSMAMGKRKYLLSKVNEKQSTEVRETIENDSKTSHRSESDIEQGHSDGRD
jgi:hypothetical protein